MLHTQNGGTLALRVVDEWGIAGTHLHDGSLVSSPRTGRVIEHDEGYNLLWDITCVFDLYMKCVDIREGGIADLLVNDGNVGVVGCQLC